MTETTQSNEDQHSRQTTPSQPQRQSQTGSRSRSPLRHTGPLLWVVITGATIALGVLTYPELPAEMTIHWRMGLDGTVTATQTVPKALGGFLFAPIIVATTLLAWGLSGRVREEVPGIGRWYDVVVMVVLLAFAGLQALLLVLNL